MVRSIDSVLHENLAFGRMIYFVIINSFMISVAVNSLELVFQNENSLIVEKKALRKKFGKSSIFKCCKDDRFQYVRIEQERQKGLPETRS